MSDEESDNDNGLFPNLGSTNTDSRDVRVRFVNRCPYPVDVFWLSSEKKPTKFGTLRQKQHLDIRTYKNHPWVARRSFDGFKLKMNEKPVFWPQPGNPNVIVRTYCFITAKVLSLKEMASRSLVIQNPAIVPEDLSLPRDLQFEVRGFLDKKKEYSEIVCRSIPPPRRPTQPPPSSQ
ncbi:unnamed protein product [Caenorhabditis brenneri]